MLMSAVTLWVLLAPWINVDALSARTATEVDAHLPHYTPSEPLASGTLHVVGSVATLHLAKSWAEALHTYHPALQVRIHSIEAARTPAWWQLTKQPTVAVLSEPMTEAEVVDFRHQWGYEPTHQPVALSAIAFIVHPSNRIAKRGLTLPVLRAIFSQTRSPGHPPMQHWGDLLPPWLNKRCKTS
jgi:ABC-type phosphate transport system substrate-binding protein